MQSSFSDHWQLNRYRSVIKILFILPAVSSATWSYPWDEHILTESIFLGSIKSGENFQALK